LGGYGDAAHEHAAVVGDGFMFGRRTEDVFGAWDRIRERVVQQARPVESFGGEYVVMSRTGPEEVAARIEAWRDAGGTHAAVLTMGLGESSSFDSPFFGPSTSAATLRMRMPPVPSAHDSARRRIALAYCQR
jgi:hypothetical protein